MMKHGYTEHIIKAGLGTEHVIKQMSSPFKMGQQCRESTMKDHSMLPRTAAITADLPV